MILNITFSDYVKEINKWMIIYEVSTENGQKYSQKVEFVNKDSMLSYKRSLQMYIYTLNERCR